MPDDTGLTPPRRLVVRNEFAVVAIEICGGPGRENMFPVVATYSGNLYAHVETTGGFAPVLSLRTDCAALSELACSTGPAGGVADLVYTIVEPGQYYLAVDQAQIGAGGYSLRVDFD